jgi:hypothetical protein
MTTLNEDGAISLARMMIPHLEAYAKEHGDASTVTDGLFALAFVTAYLLCSRGVDTEIARRGFDHALDHAIAIAPPDEVEPCTPNSSMCHDTRH